MNDHDHDDGVHVHGGDHDGGHDHPNENVMNSCVEECVETHLPIVLQWQKPAYSKRLYS